MPIDAKAVVQEIDEVVAKSAACGGQRISTNGSHSSATDSEVAMAVTLLSAAIERLAPPDSHYVKEAAKVRAPMPGPFQTQYWPLRGILLSLKADYEAGRLRSVRELIHADLFADLLEASKHLLDEGYKDPAAVLAGSSLEAHLRRLADKNGVKTSQPDSNGVDRPRKSSAIAADLAKTSPPALSKLDSKSVTTWLDLRNDAAHGHHAKYVASQVDVMISGIREFIARVPA